MNLYETLQALEAKNITIALDLGVHQSCALGSNCPLAVQLRKLIGEAGITLEELLEGFQEVTVPDPIDWDRIIPQVNAVLDMQLMGQTIHINLADAVTSGLAVAVKHKMDNLDRGIVDVKTIGCGLYSRYKLEIQRQRESATLPQLAFSIRELVSANCMVTVRDRKYNIILPFKYKPDSIVRGNNRYRLSDEHMQVIRRDVFIKYTIKQNYTLYRADVINAGGSKFKHYHGNSNYDCWGHVNLPPRWDGRLSSLVALTHSLSGALATINRDSVLERYPDDMPGADELIENGTLLGEEGVAHISARRARATDITVADINEAATPQPTPRQGWGTRGRRTEQTTTPNTEELDAAMVRRYGRPMTEGDHNNRRGLTPEEERMRRFNAPERPTNLDIRCNLCGERAGRHFGAVTICPRDHR